MIKKYNVILFLKKYNVILFLKTFTVIEAAASEVMLEAEDTNKVISVILSTILTEFYLYDLGGRRSNGLQSRSKAFWKGCVTLV